MPSITNHPETATSITVKNTFIDVQKEVEDVPRRSQSVPRAFKLSDHVKNTKPCRVLKFAECTFVDPVDTDDSTNASDKDFPDRWSDHEIPDYCSDCTEDNDTIHQGVESVPMPLLEQPSSAGTAVVWTTQESLMQCQAKADIGKVTLSLDNMVTEESRRRLRSQAQPFKSARTPPAEVTKTIASAVEVLATGKDIMDVQVHDGGMGGTTMIVAQSSCAHPDPQCTFSLVKDSLLRSAEQSQNTYVLGYGAQPFNNLDRFSFSLKLAHVPAAHRQTECWDHYEKGFCSQYSKCCWNHPSETDMMRIIVMIKKYA